MEIGIMLFIVVVIGVVLFKQLKSKSNKEPKIETLSINNDLLSIRINKSKYAGCVDSIVVRGKEYVNVRDHGRLFQTALQVDGYGECFNPTEAGSYSGISSTLKGTSISNNTLSTSVQAVSWATEPDGKARCDKGKYPSITVPTDTVINKKISIENNLITWDVSINSPSAKEEFNIEILTGYLTADFTRLFVINPGSKKLTEITEWKSLNSKTDGYPDGATIQATGYNQTYPVIFTTADTQHAIGGYRTSGIKKKEISAYHALKFNLDGGILPSSNSCSKFSILNSGPVSAITNNPSFQVKLAVGTLDEVHQSIVKLILKK